MCAHIRQGRHMIRKTIVTLAAAAALGAVTRLPRLVASGSSLARQRRPSSAPSRTPPPSPCVPVLRAGIRKLLALGSDPLRLRQGLGQWVVVDLEAPPEDALAAWKPEFGLATGGFSLGGAPEPFRS